MRNFGLWIIAAGLIPGAFGADEPSSAAVPTWNSKAAASYLDQRAEWWMGWKTSARDHDTFCVSCHTTIPYAMARPGLRAALGEKSPSVLEQKLVANVTKRVQMWNDVLPFYPDNPKDSHKTLESRGTESILNALVLTSFDASNSKLSEGARLALDNMWGQQIKDGEGKGSWKWLQFHNSPWEGDSQYYGSTLAALAVGTAPEAYRNKPEIQSGLKILREYLVKERNSQILMNRVILLWASTKIPGLLTAAEQKVIVDEALSKQQSDGGFSVSSLVGDWKRRDNTALESKSDGLATGTVIFVLQQAGIKRNDKSMKRGIDWLAANQEKTDGRWLAYSLNKQRDLTSDVGRFMSDAATAYAVLALNTKD